MADAERAEDCGRDVSLDWLAAAVEEEEAQRSVLRKTNWTSVKRPELAAAVQVEEQREYHWHCLPRLWLGGYSTRNWIAWSQKHF